MAEPYGIAFAVKSQRRGIARAGPDGPETRGTGALWQRRTGSDATGRSRAPCPSCLLASRTARMGRRRAFAPAAGQPGPGRHATGVFGSAGDGAPPRFFRRPASSLRWSSQSAYHCIIC